ncbi:MAG TPA: hypothetical protein VKE70_34320 [Candidatus Solibacter sp.]|nr:hypothetical protein [Candidatus Solibacter sp.]
MTEETGTVHEGPAATAAGLQDAPWRQYPHLDAAVEVGNSPVVAAIERTWNEIVRLTHSGTAREQERARTVMKAYSRVLELYRQLVELRGQAPGTSPSNMRGAPAIRQ